MAQTRPGLPSGASYADLVRVQMKTAHNPTRRPIPLRVLASQLKYSYEHLRKIVKGEALPSPELNAELSAALGLDARKMLRLAEREKIRRRYNWVAPELSEPGEPRDLQATTDPAFAAVWSALSAHHQQVVFEVAQAFVTASRAKTAVQEVR